VSDYEITDEMCTQKFLLNDENFFNMRKITMSDLDRFKIGEQVVVRKWSGVNWVLSREMTIVGHRVHLKNGIFWWPNFDRLLFDEFERGMVAGFKVAVQLRPPLGARYYFHSEGDNHFDAGSVAVENVTSYNLADVLRPQPPSVKRMLTSVNLHRLAYGRSMLPKTVDEEELREHYKTMKEKSDVHHG